MGYMHINNLYKDQQILLFRECFALEKIHGTSAHISWNGTDVHFSSGGEKHERFVKLFDAPALTRSLLALGHPSVTVYGEAYGGSQQGQKWRYGETLRFVAFEVEIGDVFLAVPQALDVVTKLGLEFVHFVKTSTDLSALDAERDAPSEQAKRNGIVGDQPREGVVLRPLVELKDNAGSRVIAKHKRDDERETSTTRKVVDPGKLEVLTRATEIADEWVTPTRLAHVLDKLGSVGMERVRDVIAAMTEDILREGAGELVDSREARAAIAKKTVEVFKAKLRQEISGAL
jgi:RNA ligase